MSEQCLPVKMIHPLIQWRARRIIVLYIDTRKTGIDHSIEIDSLYTDISNLEYILEGHS